MKRLALLLLLLLCPLSAAQAQRLLPDPPVLPGFGGLCDGGPLPCTRIDKIAFNAHADGLIASGTQRRDLAFLASYGVSIGLLERLEVGATAWTAAWRQGEEEAWQQGPLRFELKGLLWPVFRKDPHRSFTVAGAFQCEGPAGPFDGQNQLGRFGQLGTLRLILNKPFGLAEVGLVGGGLWDWRGHYGTAELGARAGLHLPILDIKVFAEGLIRGLPAINASEELPAIGPHGVLALGLISRAARAVDVAVVVNVGFGEVAPLFVNVRLLDLGIGEGYPRPEGLLIVMAKELGAWIRSWPIDPYLKKNCVLYDDDGKPMTRLGVLSPDGRHCLWQGKKLPIGVHFWRDRHRTRVCHDRRLQDCFMQRAGPQAPWTPIERPVLHKDCYLHEGSQILSRMGTPAPDGRGCLWEGKTVPIGQPFWRAPGSRRVCDTADRTRQRWCLELGQDRPLSPLQYVTGRFAGGMDKGGERVSQQAGAVMQTVEELAEGRPVQATTVAQEAERRARSLIESVRTATVEDAKRLYQGTVQQAQIWYTTIPPLEKMGDVAEAVGQSVVPAPTDVAVGAAVGKAVGGMVAAGTAVRGGARAGAVGSAVRKGTAAPVAPPSAHTPAPSASTPPFNFHDLPSWSTPRPTDAAEAAAEAAAAKRAREQATRELDRHLTAAGQPAVPGTAAHHIVPWGEKSRDAVKARELLQRFGIDINAAENGARLPNMPGCKAPGCYHPKLHTDRYYEAVHEELKEARSREHALRILRSIKVRLIKGVFPH